MQGTQRLRKERNCQTNLIDEKLSYLHFSSIRSIFVDKNNDKEVDL
jgi:hypothetical protein